MIKVKISNCISEKIKKQGNYNKILSDLMTHDKLTKEELEKDDKACL